MIPNLNKVKLPFLEREKCAIPEIEFRYVFVFIHRPGAWTLDFAFTFNTESILFKKGDTRRWVWKMEKEFFFQKIPIGKTGFLQFYQERMIIFWFYRSQDLPTCLSETLDWIDPPKGVVQPKGITTFSVSLPRNMQHTRPSFGLKPRVRGKKKIGEKVMPLGTPSEF